MRYKIRLTDKATGERRTASTIEFEDREEAERWVKGFNADGGKYESEVIDTEEKANEQI